MKYEYLVGRMNGKWTVEEQQRQLNESGAEGWELISVIKDEEGIAFYFRRCVQDISFANADVSRRDGSQP